MYPLWPYHAAWNPGMPAGTCAGGAIPGPMSAEHVAATAGRVGRIVAIRRRPVRRTRITRSNSLAKVALRVASGVTGRASLWLASPLGLRFVRPVELRERRAGDPARPVPHVAL